MEVSLFFAQGDYQHCLDILLYHKYNSNIYHRIIYALCKFRLNETGIAIQYLENQIQLHPNDYHLYCTLGYIQRRCKLYYKSLVSFFKAISLSKENQFAINNIMILLIKTNHSIPFSLNPFQPCQNNTWKQFLELNEINRSPFTAYSLIQTQPWNDYFYHYLALSYCGNTTKLLEFCKLGKQIQPNSPFWNYLELFAYNRSPNSEFIIDTINITNTIPLFVIYELVLYYFKKKQIDKAESLLSSVNWIKFIKFQILNIQLLFAKNNLPSIKLAYSKLQSLQKYDIIYYLQLICLYKMNGNEFDTKYHQFDFSTAELKYMKLKLGCKQSISNRSLASFEQRYLAFEKIQVPIQMNDEFKLQCYILQCKYMFYLKRDFTNAYHIWYNHIQNKNQLLDFIIPLYYRNQIKNVVFWRELAEYLIENGKILMGMQSLKYTILSFRFVRMDLIFPLLKIYYLCKDYDMVSSILKKLTLIPWNELPIYYQIYFHAMIHHSFQIENIIKYCSEFEKKRFEEEMCIHYSTKQLFDVIKEHQCKVIIEYLYQNQLYQNQQEHVLLLEKMNKYEYLYYCKYIYHIPIQEIDENDTMIESYYHYQYVVPRKKDTKHEMISLFESMMQHYDLEYLKQLSLNDDFHFKYTPISWLSSTNSNIKLYNSNMSIHGIIQCLLSIKSYPREYQLIQMNHLLMKREEYYPHNFVPTIIHEMNTINGLIQFVCQCDATLILYSNEEQILYDNKLYQILEKIFEDVIFQLLVIYYSGFEVSETCKIYFFENQFKVYIPFGMSEFNENWIPNTQYREWIRKLNQFITVDKQKSVLYKNMEEFLTMYRSFKQEYITLQVMYMKIYYSKKEEEEQIKEEEQEEMSKEKEEQQEQQIDKYLIKILQRKLKLQKKYIQQVQQSAAMMEEFINEEEQLETIDSLVEKQQSMHLQQQFIENYYKILQSREEITSVSNV